MSYIIRGALKASLCNDCTIPVTNTSVKLYAADNRENDVITATAATKETFHEVDAESLKQKEKRFLGEAKLNSAGEYSLEIDNKKYQGGAVDIDWYCGTGPVILDPKPSREADLQFHITTFQPQWRQGREDIVARFDYLIPSKWFCEILKRYDIWVICGLVTDCQTQKPVAGVNVLAFDVDWLEDDPLGNAYTDVNGKFFIAYPGDNFRKTLLSWLNVEWPAGPDYYFKIESSSGATIMAEDRNRGHQSDRENAYNCFCVKLCVDGVVTAEYPWFTSVGHFSITSDIDATGKTSYAVAGAGGDGFGFFESVKLGGYATKRHPSAPSGVLWYRFQYSFDNSNWNDITEAQMATTQLLLGKRQITWNGLPAFQNVFLDINQPASVPDALPGDTFPAPTPPHIIRADANGWIRVDQQVLDNGFVGPLACVDTNKIAGGGNASGGVTVGTMPTAAQQKNGTIVYFRFQITDDPTNPAAPNLITQTAPIAKILVNNWNEVSLIRLEELFSGGGTGCNPVTTSATVKYTVDHELIAAWSITANSSAIPGGITGLPSGNVIRGDADTFDLATLATLSPAFNTWPSCAYSIILHTRRKLTTGEQNDHTKSNQIIFCR